MKKKEEKLFLELSKFKGEPLREKMLEYATPQVLGMLFYHRMQGVAYGRLRESGLLGKVNREFRNSLQQAYENNVERNHSFERCVMLVENTLRFSGCRVALLKGAYLCLAYPDGYRTSNDIDLLVLPEDITKVGKLLYDAGFRQGHLRNGEFIPASRREIVESRMMRGETVPYIKEVNYPHMKYLEVDINFSLDYKNGDPMTIRSLLERTHTIVKRGVCIPTLEKSDFFIHLCVHLYKEAMTLPWIKMKRDMTLYKYSDIYFMLAGMTEEEIRAIFCRAKELGLLTVCAYAILCTGEIYGERDSLAICLAEEILEADREILLRVEVPEEKKQLFYVSADIQRRFFSEKRMQDLREEKRYEEAFDA